MLSGWKHSQSGVAVSAPMVERLLPEIAASDVLIVEATREAEAGMAALAAERPELFFLTTGPSLIDLLGPEDWAQVEKELSQRGIPGMVAAKFQPWYAPAQQPDPGSHHDPLSTAPHARPLWPEHWLQTLSRR